MLYPTRRRSHGFYPTLLLMLACAFALFGAAKCHAQNKPEEASFRIEVGEGQGSGTGISETLVLTNAHVAQHLDARARIWHTLTKQEWAGQVVSMYRDADLALIYVPSGGVPWVPVNSVGLQADLPVHAYGYGRQGVLRRGNGHVTGVIGTRARTIEVWNTGLTIEPGDSGSGIFNEQGELVGVNWGADKHTHDNAATSSAHVVTMWRHFVETQCPGGRCPTGGMFSGPPTGRGQMIPVRPPVAGGASPAPPAVIAGPTPPTTPDKPSTAFDADVIAEALIERLAGDPRLKGPKGDPGPPGKDGQDGRDAEVDYDRIVAEVERRLDYQRIAGMVRVDPPKLPTAQQHVVVVADTNASYWPRLASELSRAREAYHRIDLERPPADRNFGELPALVWYENGIPVRQVRGYYDVSTELITISRGEAMPLN